MSRAYYNEFDKGAAAWLRELIAAGHIAPGDVDERDIQDVLPSDLAGYTQCHFFAGIGVWSYALRKAGWSDDRPVWTGSCPCQPFSAAGKGAAFDDERHLWPAFHHLIEQCRPPAIFGEQVASKDGLAWLDLVHADMEGTGYAFGAVDLCAAGVGAPHIRQRLWWVADSEELRRQGQHLRESGGLSPVGATNLGCIVGLAHPNGRDARAEREQRSGKQRQQSQDGGVVRLADAEQHDYRCQAESADHAQSQSDGPANRTGGCGCSSGGTADANEFIGGQGSAIDRGRNSGSDAEPRAGSCGGELPCRPGPTNGYWRDADWLGCTDAKWRPASAKPQPLVDGSAESLGRVRAEVIAKIEEEINAQSMESEIRRASVLRGLQEALGAQSNACWTAGRIPRLHEAPFLLAFLRQLTAQGWSLTKDSPLPRSQAAGGELRMLRGDEQSTSAPRRYGLDEQRSGEYSDAVHFLSSLLARHALTEWDNAYAAYAELGFPLAHDARSRVVRLRGYGNAINAEAATEFVVACLGAME